MVRKRLSEVSDKFGARFTKRNSEIGNCTHTHTQTRFKFINYVHTK